MRVLLLTLLLLGCTTQTAGPNRLMVPGAAVGDLQAGATLTDAKTLFGAANVQPIQINLGEGESALGVAIFANDEANRIEFLMDSRQRLIAAHIDATDSRCHLVGEIGIGSSLKQLEQTNGGPFALYGFEWDLGGTVTNWRQGKMAKFAPHLSLRLTPDSVSEDTIKLLGDTQFPSEAPEMQRVNPVVSEIWIDLPVD
ncbi:hypothetical protein [Ferrimonas futtsuensis]|uniref:hypothetical protein n=1 Tax=Ferrimonas futtsuensis TaxID=364764 RepID=UPI00047F4290|nr:hypothetical protein [Ferrimonas futtsuensis]